MSTQNTIIVGLDVGYGHTKAVASNGRSVCFESKVAPAEFIRFQADIGAQARTLWNISTLNAIVLAGGGSLILQPWLAPRFSQAIYAPDAAMANAAGFLRYGLRQWSEAGR